MGVGLVGDGPDGPFGAGTSLAPNGELLNFIGVRAGPDGTVFSSSHPGGSFVGISNPSEKGALDGRTAPSFEARNAEEFGLALELGRIQRQLTDPKSLNPGQTSVQLPAIGGDPHLAHFSPSIAVEFDPAKRKLLAQREQELKAQLKDIASHLDDKAGVKGPGSDAALSVRSARKAESTNTSRRTRGGGGSPATTLSGEDSGSSTSLKTLLGD